MSYIKSENIEVFPSGFRGTGYIKSKWTSEENLTRLNRLSSIKELNSFVIDDFDDADNYIIVGIYGYFFRIKKSEISGNNLKASIILRDSGSAGKVLDNISSSGQVLDDDGTGEFKGLYIGADVKSTLNVDLTDSDSNIKYQKLRLDTTEVRDNTSNKDITEEFTTEKVTTTNLIADESSIDDLTVNNTTKVKTLEASGDITTEENLEVKKTTKVQDLELNGSLKCMGVIPSQGGLYGITDKGVANLSSATVNGNVNASTFNEKQLGTACEKSYRDNISSTSTVWDGELPTIGAVKTYIGNKFKIDKDQRTITAGDNHVRFGLTYNSAVGYILNITFD